MIEFYEDDKEGAMRAILKRSDVAIDVSGADGIEFRMWRAHHAPYEAPAAEGPCSLTTDGTDGDVYWDTDLTGLHGRFHGTYRVDWGGGAYETIPDAGHIEITVHGGSAT